MCTIITSINYAYKSYPAAPTEPLVGSCALAERVFTNRQEFEIILSAKLEKRHRLMKSFHWLFWKISYLPSFSILQSLYRKRYLTVSPFRILLLANALDKVENRKLQKIVPDLKELLKIGILMHRHKGNFI